MSEELLQRDLINNPEKIGKWFFYNIGNTSINKLKEYGIIQNKNYGKIENKKVDAILVKDKNVIAVIENKSPSNFNTPQKKEKAIKQEIEVAKNLDCKLIIATDTIETVWVNVLTGNRILDENNVELKYNFNPNDEKLPELIEKIIVSINEKNDRILPKNLINPTDLAKRIWQILWSISGATPESCLYSFVELFIFKYLSDLGVLKEPRNFESLIKLYNIETPEFVIDEYARNIRRKIKNELFTKGADGTTIINGTVFVNNDDEAIDGRSTAFEKILREFNSYGKLDNIHPDFKSKLFETFLKESISKKNWGQFFTPLKVVNAIIEMAKDEIKAGKKICDPACGVGKFLLEAVKPQLNQFYKVEANELKNNIEIFGYDIGFDKDEQKTIILAKANMLIYFSDLIRDNNTITGQFAELFNKSFELKKNSILGTLATKTENKYDLILSNPPYVTSGSSNIKEEIKRKGLSDYYKVNAMGLEGLFMEWIIRALKPDGKAFVVLPFGAFSRQNDRNLRQFILDECIIDGVISLPGKTFFSTPQKTYILCITKKTDKKEIQTAPVFTYLVSEIGESRNVYRFDIEQNDLNNAINLYSFFKGNKTEFEKINTDKRCKIQQIEKFMFEAIWEVDEWWSKEEQIELGIKEENKKIKLEEVSELLEELANNTLSFKEELNADISNEQKTFQEIAITDKHFFELTRGKRITKETIDKNKGNIPVYSSSKNKNSVLGFIDETYLKKNNLILFSEPSILVNLDGSVGYCFIREDKKYSFIDVVASIKSKDKNIDLNFLLYELRKEILKTGATYQTKLYFNKMATYNITIKIPINSKGEFDLDAQKEIAEKYKFIDRMKEDLKNQMNNLLNIQIEI